VREIEALHLAAIAAAQTIIYVEGQYFAARCIGEALARRLQERDGPEVVVIIAHRSHGWLADKAMRAARTRLLAYLAHADRYGRLRIYQPVTDSGAPIYVHAKVLAIDDRLLRIGSANLNNRSMGLDTECDLAIEARANAPDAAAISQFIIEIRNGLVAEHLQLSPDRVAAELAAYKGSLIGAIEANRRDQGRSLTPIEAPAADPRPPGDGEILDPECAEPLPRKLVHAVQDWLARRTLR
jgi:phospholipase D1/2